MTALALYNGLIFDGEAIRDGHAVLIDNDRIRALLPEVELPAALPRQSLEGGLLVPGFIDLQVNGGGGVLFNDHPTVTGIRAIAAAHGRYGTTGLLPTLISSDAPTMAAAVAAVAEARRQGVPGVLGIHLEGPYLNPTRKGVHDPRWMRPVDAQLPQWLDTPDLGSVLLTLAPEQVEADLIRGLSARGVRVFAGHTAASYEQVRTALEAGLSGFTHLFNAMTPLDSREPGVVGAALEHTASWCGLIVDGHHVHPATLRVALAAKTPGRMFLVTDAMPTVGWAGDSFPLDGRTIHRADGRLTTADGTLAGSDLDMASAVRNTVNLLGLPLEEALRMASLYPAQCLGLDHARGRIAPGYRADLVLLDEGLRVQRTWIGGAAVHP
ncbi:MAG TPA: N-acetylglucosamine-6-phosphate deacetylase [Candidatus Competibacteraceae bacterium]|nr:N-acetylglucosamine-6-phosphate deacetylase [Candidatus Competibacteraceae bacterium]